MGCVLEWELLSSSSLDQTLVPQGFAADLGRLMGFFSLSQRELLKKGELGRSCLCSAGLALCRREEELKESISCTSPLKVMLDFKCERQFSVLLKFKLKKK